MGVVSNFFFRILADSMVRCTTLSTDRNIMLLGEVLHLWIHWGEIQSFAWRHDKAIALRQGIEQ